MKYMEIVEYLKDKYGLVPKNYFTKGGNKTQGITRGNEGLYIHHIDEDKMILLSNKIGNHPVVNDGLLNENQINLVEKEFQKADRLVYCDLLEHLLLHLKIVEEPKPLISEVKVGIGGIVNFIVPELNDIYSGIQYNQEWKQEVVLKVIDRKSDFFKLLKYGIKNLNIERDEYISSLPLNSFIWEQENNFKLFKEFDEYLSEN